MTARGVFALLAALSLVSACSSTAGSSGVAEPAGSDTSTPPVEQPAAEEPSTDRVAVGQGPVGLTVDPDGAVWVVSAGAETVSRIPRGATQPDLVVDVPGVPLRAVAAYDAIWVTAFGGNELVRIDPGSGQVTDRIPTGAGPEGLVAAFDAIWLVAQDAGRLLRVDPATGTVVQRLDIGVGARLVTAGGPLALCGPLRRRPGAAGGPGVRRDHPVPKRLQRTAGPGRGARPALGRVHRRRRRAGPGHRDPP